MLVGCYPHLAALGWAGLLGPRKPTARVMRPGGYVGADLAVAVLRCSCCARACARGSSLSSERKGVGAKRGGLRLGSDAETPWQHGNIRCLG